MERAPAVKVTEEQLKYMAVKYNAMNALHEVRAAMHKKRGKAMFVAAYGCNRNPSVCGKEMYKIGCLLWHSTLDVFVGRVERTHATSLKCYYYDCYTSAILQVKTFLLCAKRTGLLCRDVRRLVAKQVWSRRWDPKL